MATAAKQLVPLEKETRKGLPTGEMARHLGRAAKTLYQWQYFGTYPACLKPTKDGNGRLHWPVAGALQFLNGEAA
jgi:hypothetical protein